MVHAVMPCGVCLPPGLFFSQLKALRSLHHQYHPKDQREPSSPQGIEAASLTPWNIPKLSKTPRANNICIFEWMIFQILKKRERWGILCFLLFLGGEPPLFGEDPILWIANRFESCILKGQFLSLISYFFCGWGCGVAIFRKIGFKKKHIFSWYPKQRFFNGWKWWNSHGCVVISTHLSM